MRILLFAALASFATSAYALDEHSYARYDRVRVREVYLDLEADFAKKQLAGFAELALDWRRADARTLDLDTRDLAIERVAYADGQGGWHAVRHALAPRDPALGAKLTIALPRQAPRVRIWYRTSPRASGLQWLDAAQTQGKRHPFMFSQSQAIHARSWVPLQDTPAVRFTYRARITAPAGLRAVMSADNDPGATGAGGWRFAMPQRIPSYLLAIAVGRMEFRALGPRTGVYAEPERIAAAASEFVDTERMMDAAEALYGPYRWGRYDILVLPPSFPFGGMENPRLTFATPTIIAGDRSLVALIAHELAHSWSGNLVTNAAWKHFWLNEGFTTYVENRIVESLYGREMALMQQVIDQTDLFTDLRQLAPGDQWLVPEIGAHRDPDEIFSDVPYAKGAWLLRTLEKRVGRAAFDPFVRGWFDAHAFGSVTTDDFLVYLRRNLLAKHPDAITGAELDAWLYQPGVPKEALFAKSASFAAIDTARERWLAGEIDADALGAKAWVTQEWLHFLDQLPAMTTRAQLGELDAAWRLSTTGNAEIAYRWFRAGIRAGYEPIRAPMRAYLLGIGRRKLVVPLYEELAKRPADRQWALDVYRVARPGYHPVTQHTVDQKLGLAK
jgi:leukotriene-A4 hydrolase